MRNTCRLSALAIVTIYFFSPFSYAAKLIDTKIVVGGYSSTQTGMPLLATSNDHGKIWHYPSNIYSKLPTDFTFGRFNSVSCQQNFCMAAGEYQSASSRSLPLIAITQDSGVLWSYISTMPSDGKEMGNNIAHTSCNNSFCVLTSSYINKQAQLVPLIAVTHDQGKSWHYPTILESSRHDALYPNAIDCTDTSCVAVGRSEFQYRLPSILVSTDQAATWSYPTLKLPAEYQRAELRSIKCKDNVCIASGSYTTANDNEGAFILRSVDKGVSWSVASTDYQPLTDVAFPESVTFIGNTWIVSGMYKAEKEKGYNPFHPLVFISHDDGATWTRPPTILSNLPSDIYWNAYGSHVSCTGDLCMMPIYVIDRPPYMAISNDQGITWSYTNLSSDVLTGFSSFKNMRCDEESCFASGYYKDSTYKDQAAVVVSHDQGKTWQVPPTIRSNRPADYDNYGNFFDSASAYSARTKK